MKEYDLAVIGGGINGAGIAADAAGRGLKVILIEQNDLASATSSASSKLIHGGLRYLEHYEFSLVRKALKERETLLKIAPHIVSPIRFRLPYLPNLRPAWMIRAGLFLYDHLARRVSLPGSKMIHFDEQSPLIHDITKGFEYSDCWVDDARLVVLNALSAKKNGTEVYTQTRCVQAVIQANYWRITLEQKQQEWRIKAKALVNATGPWAQSFIEQQLQTPAPKQVRLIKGSHIVTERLFSHQESYILQIEDGRIVFVIPYLHDFTLIGTTDIEYQGDPAKVSCSVEEEDYLIDVVNTYFKKKITREQIHYRYSGVRPLMEDKKGDPSKVTRDYELTLAVEPAPLLSVFGGKITTYRQLANHALNKLRLIFPDLSEPWTHRLPLPGGDFTDRDTLLSNYQQQYSTVDKTILKRWVQSYGRLSEIILQTMVENQGLGQDFGHGLSAVEVDYLCTMEWAVTAEDILWRRTKLGLYFSDQQKQALQDYLVTKIETAVA